MIIHRTNPSNRESILRDGLIPSNTRSEQCQNLLGYVNASIDYGYFDGEFNPDKWDYWQITNMTHEPCRCSVYSDRCKSAVIVKGIIPPENLNLLKGEG